MWIIVRRSLVEYAAKEGGEVMVFHGAKRECGFDTKKFPCFIYDLEHVAGGFTTCKTRLIDDVKADFPTVRWESRSNWTAGYINYYLIFDAKKCDGCGFTEAACIEARKTGHVGGCCPDCRHESQRGKS